VKHYRLGEIQCQLGPPLLKEELVLGKIRRKLILKRYDVRQEGSMGLVGRGVNPANALGKTSSWNGGVLAY